MTRGKRWCTAASSRQRLHRLRGTPSAVARPASISTAHARDDSAIAISAIFAEPLKSVWASSRASQPSAYRTPPDDPLEPIIIEDTVRIVRDGLDQRLVPSRR